jgi:hypothetical protein
MRVRYAASDGRCARVPSAVGGGFSAVAAALHVAPAPSSAAGAVDEQPCAFGVGAAAQQRPLVEVDPPAGAPLDGVQRCIEVRPLGDASQFGGEVSLSAPTGRLVCR